MRSGGLVVGCHQQEVGLHYLLILLIAVGVTLMTFSDCTMCRAVPLLQLDDTLAGVNSLQGPPARNLRRPERSISDYLKNLFTSGSSSAPDDTSGSNGARPSSSAGSSNNNFGGGGNFGGNDFGGNNFGGNGGSSSGDAGGNNPDNSNGDSTGSGGGGGNGNSGSRPPAVRDAHPSASHADSSEKGVTGNKWIDLVINAVVGNKNNGGGENGESGGSSSGSGGSGVGTAIVDALVGAAAKHILVSVLG